MIVSIQRTFSDEFQFLLWHALNLAGSYGIYDDVRLAVTLKVLTRLYSKFDMIREFSIACGESATEYSRRFESLLPFSQCNRFCMPIICLCLAVLRAHHKEKKLTSLNFFFTKSARWKFLPKNNCDAIFYAFYRMEFWAHLLINMIKCCYFRNHRNFIIFK